jgi:anthranilate phosphoribosyltransferase
MSDIFRDLLKKIGSGPHTGKSLTREEATIATRLMLSQGATPTQIGAFMIAHRIKRPTPEEMAGMLDAYDQVGPRLRSLPRRPVVFGIPYDGRSRTAPLLPITALLLAAADCPVILHGGDRMPTKHGVPLVELWQGLGVDWTTLSLAQLQEVLAQTGLGLVYLPHHFPQAHALVPYRDQIGKRPPFATAELFWCPYEGDALVISGYVHPPTEELAIKTFALRGVPSFITVKGLEGSCDLPRDRTAIIGVHKPDGSFERHLLHSRDYKLHGSEIPLPSSDNLGQTMLALLTGTSNELMAQVLWNGGFYLWQCGKCGAMAEGIELARDLIQSGLAFQKLEQVRSLQFSLSKDLDPNLDDKMPLTL